VTLRKVIPVVKLPNGSCEVSGTTAPLFVRFGDSPSLDAFARLRVSNPVTLFDSQSQYDTQPFIFQYLVAGAGTYAHDPANSAVNLTVTTASGDRVVRQSREYIRYQPGKSLENLVTGTFAAGQASMIQRMGYMDDSNGLFLQEENGAVSVVLRSSASGSPVNTVVPQASWNVDPMNGTGPSGLTLDITKSQIFFMDIEWLGVGRARVGFVVNGLPWYVHEFNHANIGTGVYMTTANLPMRWEIVNTGLVAAGASLKSICASSISEGGFDAERGYPFATGTAPAGVGSIGATEVSLLAIRPKSTFNSITNRSTIRLANLSVLALSEPIMIRVYYGCTVTGGSWADVDATSSAVQHNLSGTISVGTKVAEFQVASGGGAKASGSEAAGILSRLPLTMDIAGTGYTNLGVVAVRCGSGPGTATAVASISWLEYR
jgi:hypothetical protein